MLLRIEKDNAVKLILRTYSYPNPFEKRIFHDERNWKILKDEKINSSQAILDQLKNLLKISLVCRDSKKGEQFRGLLLQTNLSIWFYDIKHPD